ncbi:MAG TPA: hypothetical protein VH969_23260 [Actinophytocola sp.]|uniref:hypothetical protein n=1 Tax=Actinophytocola sp. TaxID=1872138 RepID=UPI002F9243D6
MSSHRSPRIRRDAAEQLLDGGPATTEADRPLATVLHVAAAPAHPAELSGERAALAAFEAAQLTPAPSPRRQNVLKSTLAKILTVKAAVVLAAAAGTTGVVLASTSGALTPSDGPSEHRPADHPPAVHSPAHTPAGTSRDNNGDSAGKSGDAPSPSMAGLCNAYEAHKDDNPGKALDSPAFKALISAAGGEDNVDEYCDAIAASKDTGRPDDSHGKPTDRPDNPGNGHGNGGDPGNGDDPADGGDPGNGNAPATHPAAPPRGH